jgi:hypothetical protein
MVTKNTAALFLLATLAFPLAHAKGPTAQVTITGPKLDVPLNLSNQAVTNANVWAGNFIDLKSGAVGLPRANSLLYRIHFWVQLDPNDIRMMYVLNYQWLADSNRAIVCLPGRQDPWYSLNVSTILRNGQDGNCFYADEDWGRAIQVALRNSF